MLTVYWVNTGAAFPETLELIERVRPQLPRFEEIAGNQARVIANYGFPTDLLPRTNTPMGRASGLSGIALQDSFSCCARVIMEPLHRRMLADGITLIVRGQRLAEKFKAPISSGTVENGIEYLFPIEQWTDLDVDNYLISKGQPRLRFYDYMNMMPDCMTCTGWWEEHRGHYLDLFHPQAAQWYRNALHLICTDANPLITAFNEELGEDES